MQDGTGASRVAELEPASALAPAPAAAEPLPVFERADSCTEPDPALPAAPDEVTFAHPAVLVDPRPATCVAIQSLRRRGVPLHVLGANRLDPAFWARGVRRHTLPRLAAQPEAWTARLLELAAHLEPRPLLLPFSKSGRELLRQSRPMLAPHFELAHVDALDVHEYEAEEFRTERTLRRAVLRNEPAFEVQVTLDRQGECVGACVLTWVAGVSPCVVVTSVEGYEVLERSLSWLRPRGVYGYARLIWAPDRFGRVELQAAGTLPGSGWALACADGVDFPALWYANVAGIPMRPQRAQLQLSRQLPVTEAQSGDATPLAPPSVPWSWRDPLPGLVSAVRGFIDR